MKRSKPGPQVSVASNVSSLPGYSCWRITSIISAWVGVGVGEGVEVTVGVGVSVGVAVSVGGSVAVAVSVGAVVTVALGATVAGSGVACWLISVAAPLITASPPVCWRLQAVAINTITIRIISSLPWATCFIHLLLRLTFFEDAPEHKNHS